MSLMALCQRFIYLINILIITMLNYWFKLKSASIYLLIFFITNAYLVYILIKYLVPKTTGYLFIFVTNEIFIFIGVLFYLVYDTKLKVNDKLDELEYLTKRLK